MSDRIETIEGLFGEKIHYKNGVKVGESWDGLFGGSYEHYDANGNHIGSSDVGLFSDYNHYDNHCNKVGYSNRGLFGTEEHYDDRGHIGSSYTSPFGTDTDFDDGGFDFNE